jgi:Na+-driven multidrug efflux pump
MAARLAAAVMAIIGLVMALMPELWVAMFTDDPATLDAASQYFHWVGPSYGFFGVGMSLFFSALAAGHVAPMLLAGAARLCIVIAGALLVSALSAPISAVFALIAIGSIIYGCMSMLVMARSNWQPRATTPATR